MSEVLYFFLNPKLKRTSLLDFEGFKHKELSFVIKELSFWDVLNADIVTHHYSTRGFHFCEKYRKVNRWLEKCRHGFNPSDDRLCNNDFRKDIDYLKKTYDFFFAKGLEKCLFLEKLLQRPVIDLERLKYSPDNERKCKIHRLLNNEKQYCSQAKLFGILKAIYTDL